MVQNEYSTLGELTVHFYENRQKHKMYVTKDINKKAINYLDKPKFRRAGILFLYNYYKNPNYITIHNLASVQKYYYVCLTERQKDKVIRLYKRARKKKNNCVTNYMLAKMYFEKKQYRKAAFYYREALKFKKSAELFFNTGAAYFYQKEYKKALILFKKAYHMCKSDDMYILEALVWTALQLNDIEKAKQYFGIIKAKNPDPDTSFIHFAYGCKEYDYIVDSNADCIKNCFPTAEECRLTKVAFMEQKKEKEYEVFCKEVRECITDAEDLTRQERWEYEDALTIREETNKKDKEGYIIDIVYLEDFIF